MRPRRLAGASGRPLNFIVRRLMLRKFFAALGLGSAAAGRGGAKPPYTPYSESAANDIYNMLFCDDPSAYRPTGGRAPAPWQVVLSSDPPNVPALVALADDFTQEGRTRFLAYTKLRALGQVVPAKRLLGVIVEMP